MIILEGPDGSGKSTGGEILSDILDMPLAKHSGGPVMDRESLHTRIKNQLSNYGKIVDRCSIFSEYVYGIARGKPYISSAEIEEYVGYLVAHDWSVIYFTASSEIEVGKRWKSEAHMEMIKQKRRLIHELYKSLFLWVSSLVYLKGSLRVIHFNWTEYPEEELLSRYSKIAVMADRRKHKCVDSTFLLTVT